MLCLDLIYHFSDPLSAIETQVGPHVSGQLDWGSYRFVRLIKEVFTVIDETQEVHGNEATIDGVCLAPSIEALVWIMHKVGFKDVEILEPHADAFEQHLNRKRVVAVGYV